MTPDQIKALAKQAGGTTHTTMGDRLTIFLPEALTEFVRLVREQAFTQAVESCREIADCADNTEDYRNGASWCAARIKGMK